MADDPRRFLTVEEAREQALQAFDDGDLTPTTIIDRLLAAVRAEEAPVTQEVGDWRPKSYPHLVSCLGQTCIVTSDTDFHRVMTAFLAGKHPS